MGARTQPFPNRRGKGSSSRSQSDTKDTKVTKDTKMAAGSSGAASRQTHWGPGSASRRKAPQ